MNRCKTCTWWNRDSSGLPRGWGYGECTAPRMIPRNIHDDLGQDGIVCFDPDDTYASPTFYSGPEFGCVHHEEREGVVELTLVLGDLVPGDTMEVTKGGVTVVLAVQRKIVSGGD